jgi:hypothetical protein
MGSPESFHVLGQKIENGGQARRDLDMTLIDFRAPLAEFLIQMLQFLLLGRRKAKEYERKRGAPWPPIDYAEIERILREDE